MDNGFAAGYGFHHTHSRAGMGLSGARSSERVGARCVEFLVDPPSGSVRDPGVPPQMTMQPVKRVGWIALLPLDVSLSLGIICLLVAVSAAQMGGNLDKGRLAGFFETASNARINAIEELAVRGEFAEPNSSLASMPASSDGFAYRYVGGRIDTSGTLRRGQPEFRLSLVPTTMTSGDGWTVIWSCGERRAPAGWTKLEPSFADNLEGALPYVCRKLPVE